MIDNKLYFSVLDKVVRFIAHQPRTELEVRKKLSVLCGRLKLAPDEKEVLSERIIADIKADGYLDDAKYTADYISSQLRAGKNSVIKIKSFLLRKGINKEEADTACDEIGHDYENEAAIELGSKKLRTLHDLPEKEKKRKLANYLAGKGFSSHVVFNAVDTLLGVK